MRQCSLLRSGKLSTKWRTLIFGCFKEDKCGRLLLKLVALWNPRSRALLFINNLSEINWVHISNILLVGNSSLSASIFKRHISAVINSSLRFQYVTCYSNSFLLPKRLICPLAWIVSNWGHFAGPVTTNWDRIAFNDPNLINKAFLFKCDRLLHVRRQTWI